MHTISDTFESLVEGVRSKRFPKGQIMLYQGDVPQDVLILKEGIIRVYDIDKQGNEKVLHLFKPFSIVPLAYFSGHAEEMQWFYAALTDCEVCVIPADTLLERMQADIALTISLTNWFSLEVHELLVRLSSFGKTHAREKVRVALRFLAVKHASQRRNGWWRVSFPVNQQLLADMTGLTRESTALIMKDFLDRGVIRRPRQTILEISRERLSKTAKA